MEILSIILLTLFILSLLYTLFFLYKEKKYHETEHELKDIITAGLMKHKEKKIITAYLMKRKHTKENIDRAYEEVQDLMGIKK